MANAQTWGDRSVVVTLAADGGVYLDKKAVSQATLSESIRERLAQRPDLIVVINADETIRHREVVQAMDAAKRAGAASMAIATRPHADGPE